LGETLEDSSAKLREEYHEKAAVGLEGMVEIVD